MELAARPQITETALKELKIKEDGCKERAKSGMNGVKKKKKKSHAVVVKDFLIFTGLISLFNNPKLNSYLALECSI